MSEEYNLERSHNNPSYVGGGGNNLNNSYNQNMLASAKQQQQDTPVVTPTYKIDPITVNSAPYISDSQQLPQQQQQQHMNQTRYTGNMMSPEYSEHQHGSIAPHLSYTGQQNTYHPPPPYVDNNYLSGNYGVNYGAGSFPSQHHQNPGFYPIPARTFSEQGNMGSYNNMNYPEQRVSPRPAWPILTEENVTSVPGQRKSLDETHAPPQPNFTRQHRRGRSDDACHIIDSYKDNSQFGASPGRLFHTPPPVRVGFPMHTSRSTISLPEGFPSHSMGHDNNISHNNRLPHSVSVDSSGVLNTQQIIHERLYKQSSAYVNLTTGIKMAHRKLTELEMEVIEKERELNRVLSVQKNPTEKDYLQMKEETGILHREIEQMYQECDRLEISPDPDECRTCTTHAGQTHPLTVTPVPSPSPTKYTGNPNDSLLKQPHMYQNPPTTRPHLPHGISQTIPSKPPAYETVKDPAPPYGSVTSPYSVISHQPSPLPPPLPPRPAHLLPPVPLNNRDRDSLVESEYWECPSCTFKNLLVAECEVCYTPRPNTASRHP